MSESFCITNFEDGCSDYMQYGPVPNWFDYLSTINFVFWGGIVGSVFLISNLCRRMLGNFSSDIDLDVDEIPYELLYETELQEAKEANKEVEFTDAHRKQLYLSTIVEETPRGEVVMFYDDSTESFWWFADTKDVPYKYLETVCRRYVTAYDCVPLYKGTVEEIKRIVEEKKIQKEEAEKAKEQKDNQEDGVDEAVFANLKSYNKRTGDAPDDNGAIILENTNRYSYRGKLEDWEEMQKVRERTHIPGDDDKTSLDFSSFKKIQESENETEEIVEDK